jgi:hypothetical protein
MIYFSKFDAQGQYLMSFGGTQESADLEDQAFLYYGQVDGVTHYHDLVTNTPVAKPKQPSKYHEFDYADKTWKDHRSIVARRKVKWEEIKKLRDEHEFGTFTFDGSEFDCDSVSVQRITGAVTRARYDDFYQVDWTLTNNTVRNLSALDIIAVDFALQEHVEACHARGRALRSLIELANDDTELAAIIW